MGSWLGFFAVLRFLPFFPERRVAAPVPPPRRPSPARGDPPLPDRAEPPPRDRPDPEANVAPRPLPPPRPLPVPPPELFRVPAPALPRELPLPRDPPAPPRLTAGRAPPGGTFGTMISTGSSW